MNQHVCVVPVCANVSAVIPLFLFRESVLFLPFFNFHSSVSLEENGGYPNITNVQLLISSTYCFKNIGS